MPKLDKDVGLKEIRVKKSDTLQNILKSNGYSPNSWRKVYNADFNKRFKGKFKDPEKIERGATFLVPRFSKSEIGKMAADLSAALVSLVQLTKKSGNFEKLLKKVEKLIDKGLDENRKQIDKLIDSLEKELDVLWDLKLSAMGHCAGVESCVGPALAVSRMEARISKNLTTTTALKAVKKYKEKQAKAAISTFQSQLKKLQATTKDTELQVQEFSKVMQKAMRSWY